MRQRQDRARGGSEVALPLRVIAVELARAASCAVTATAKRRLDSTFQLKLTAANYLIGEKE